MQLTTDMTNQSRTIMVTYHFMWIIFIIIINDIIYMFSAHKALLIT